MLADRVRMSYIKKGGIPIPDYYVMATDSDFSGTTNESFKYVGSHEYVIIPHIIKGVNVTSYLDMFRDNTSTVLKGIANDNPNVTVMNNMFNSSSATTLDLSSFDTSKVTNMTGMFRNSIAVTLDLSSFDTSNVTNTTRMIQDCGATTGYARTQADADRFNASSYKKVGLTFIVKP